MKTPDKAPAYAPLFPYLAARQNAGLLAEGELVIDNFAGVGGASTGMEAALGRPVDHAINHDPVAVSLHRVNHPHSHHSIEDVWQVHPLEVTKGQPVALAWFSPTCTHFSKAKGAALLDRGIRGLAWVAVRWADLVKPRVIMLENVEEFQQWGPLTPEGRPDPAQQGRTFNSFVNALRRLGYEVEWRELRACDYGTPTIRKRLFLIARRDGLPIVWPAPTHAAPTDPRVQAGLLQPYATAAQCIDWTLPCPSIFDRKKPLVRNTMNRVAQGLKRFVLTAADPFVVTCNHSGAGFRGQDLGEPFKTVVAAHEAHGLAVPQLVTYYGPKRPDEVRGQNTLEPLRVQTTENRFGLVQGYLVPRYGERADQTPRAVSVDLPSPTVVTTGNGSRLAVAEMVPFVVNKQHRNPPRAADAPLSTVTTNHSKNELVQVALAPYVVRTDMHRSNSGCTYTAEQPLTTITTAQGHGLVGGALLKIDNQRSWATCTYSTGGPIGTVVTKNSMALTTAHLVRHMGGGLAPEYASYAADEPSRTVMAKGGPQGLVSGALVACGGRGAQARPKALDECMHTITSKADMTLTTAHLTAYYSAGGQQNQGQAADAPLRTIPTVDRFGLTAATLMRQFGTSTAADVAAPLGTITTEGQGKTGLIAVSCEPALGGDRLTRARQVHDFLTEYLGTEVLAPYSQGGLIVLQVRGEWYVLADIGMRMLEPRELARCQGFPENYVLEQTAEGKPISKARQVRGIGNSVCPQLAEVLTRAQLGAVLAEAAD